MTNRGPFLNLWTPRAKKRQTQHNISNSLRGHKDLYKISKEFCVYLPCQSVITDPITGTSNLPMAKRPNSLPCHSKLNNLNENILCMAMEHYTEHQLGTSGRAGMSLLQRLALPFDHIPFEVHTVSRCHLWPFRNPLGHSTQWENSHSVCQN